MEYVMDKTESKKFIRDAIGEVDFIRDNILLRIWASEAEHYLFVLDEAPRENVASVIFNNGYIRGMEAQLHMADIGKFKDIDYLAKMAYAWRVLVNAFINKAEGKHYGFE